MPLLRCAALPLVVVVALLAGRSGAETALVRRPIGAACQARMDAWCNCEAHCKSFPQWGEYVALFGLNRDTSTHKEWRCYPVSVLTNDRNHYNKTHVPFNKTSDHICTEDKPDRLLAVLRGLSSLISRKQVIGSSMRILNIQRIFS